MATLKKKGLKKIKKKERSKLKGCVCVCVRVCFISIAVQQKLSYKAIILQLKKKILNQQPNPLPKKLEKEQNKLMASRRAIKD